MLYNFMIFIIDKLNQDFNYMILLQLKWILQKMIQKKLYNNKIKFKDYNDNIT